MRFSQVYFVLLLIALICAFAVPQRMTDSARPMLGSLLLPVAAPSRKLASWMTGRYGAAPVRTDPRSDAAILQENTELRQANALLSMELEALRRKNNEREEMGDIGSRCTEVSVIGADDGVRDVLTLRATSGLRQGMYVLWHRDIVGRLTTVGNFGAQLQLISDPSSHIEAYFGTFRKEAVEPAAPEAAQRLVRLQLPKKVCDGLGGGKMVCRNLPFAEVEKAGLSVGDWAILDDADWEPLRGRRLGIVTKITKTGKLMAEIELRPESDLKKLSKVMVLVR